MIKAMIKITTETFLMNFNFKSSGIFSNNILNSNCVCCFMFNLDDQTINRSIHKSCPRHTYSNTFSKVYIFFLDETFLDMTLHVL